MNKSPESVAQTMIDEIAQSEALSSCQSFSELHDHCDANMLGCSEELYEELGLEESCDILNAAQEIVDHSLPLMVKATWFHLKSDAKPSKATYPIQSWKKLRARIWSMGGRVISEERITVKAALDNALKQIGVSA